MFELGRLIHKHHPRFSVVIILSPALTVAPVAYDSSSITVLHLPSDPTVPPSTIKRPSISPATTPPTSASPLPTSPPPRTSEPSSFTSSRIPPSLWGSPSASQPTTSSPRVPSPSPSSSTFRPLHGSTTKSFKDLGDEAVHIPGLPPIKALDMPSGMLDRGWRIYGYLLDACRNMISSSGIIVNTSELLETRIIGAIKEGLCGLDGPTPPIFAVGPLIEPKVDGDEDGADERERKHECLSWFDSQLSRSVVLLCFGSQGRFSAVQLKEMASGLEKSGVRFLWVVRPLSQDVSAKSTSGSNDDDASLEKFLPEGFLERTRERGMVVKSWAPQIQVLNHGWVDGFVTHCGRNSTIEAVHVGVPMVAWPFYAEQKVNRAFLVGQAALALPLSMLDQDGFVSADELTKRVTELMMGFGQGKLIRERVLAARDSVLEALSNGGSSQVSLAAVAALWKRG